MENERVRPCLPRQPRNPTSHTQVVRMLEECFKGEGQPNLRTPLT